MEHWSQDFEHASITDENREAFNTHMSKFTTEADAVVDGFGLAKMKGMPFKFPESMDKLKDDATRADFTAQAHKLLGIEHAKDVEALASLNMKAGQAEGAPFDENMATAFKQFIVAKKVPKGIAQAIVEFHNQAMGQAQVADKAKTESDNLATAEACDKALIAHPSIGSNEELVKRTELFTRAIKNHVGLSPDEVEKVADSLAISKLTKDPILARIMLEQFAPLAATAETEAAGGGKPPAGEQIQDGKTEKILWPKKK